MADFLDEIGDECIEDAVERFIDGLLGGSVGVFAGDLVVELAEERDVMADVVNFEKAGVEAVVDIGGEVGDFVGQIDELCFERREDDPGRNSASSEWRAFE